VEVESEGIEDRYPDNRNIIKLRNIEYSMCSRALLVLGNIRLYVNYSFALSRVSFTLTNHMLWL
jgi:hypothetical protein